MVHYPSTRTRAPVKWKLVTKPQNEVITTAEATKHARIDGSDEDAYVDLLIAVARARVEHYTGRVLIDTVFDLFLDRFSPEILIPWPPLSTLTSVKYFDTGGTQQTLATSGYQIDDASEPAMIYPGINQPWPTVETGRINAIEVRFTAGYGANGSNVLDRHPELVHAVKELAAEYFQRRTPVSVAKMAPLSHHVNSILNAHKVYWW